MGCDIHAFIEVKVKDKWITYSKPQIKRWYKLFTKIAGVRRAEGDNEFSIIPFCELPEDLSEAVKIEYEWGEEDYHNAGFLNKKQIKEMCEWAEKNSDNRDFEHEQLGYINGNSVYGVGDPEGGYPKDFQDVRMIFWFDN